MKYKKYNYLLVLILMLMIGINQVRADDCQVLFGDPNNPDSLRYLINEILMYPKIIVPILLILLGTLDFAKAVISSKEDEMKKAQSKFITRIIAAVGVFFVPALVDLIMQLADIVWEGTGFYSCGL